MRRRPRGDRGTVAALVTVLLAGNVLLGMAALAIDVGALYVEREELQSGADAAAIAVAKACAAGNETCSAGGTQSLAVRYASDNAKDGQSAATVCGRIRTAVPPPADPPSSCSPNGAGSLARCVGSPPPDPVPYIEVRATSQANGQPALPPVFAGALTGTDGVTVGACSRVMWGPVNEAFSEVAFAVSMCDFRNATRGGREFQPAPDEGSHDPRVDATSAEVILFWRPPDDRGCGIGGRDIPEGFNWIPRRGPGPDDCDRTVRVGWEYETSLFPGSPDECAENLHTYTDFRSPVTVAVFDEVDRLDNELRVAGLATFVVTGFRYPTAGWAGRLDHDHASNLRSRHLCDATITTMCIYGYFTTRVLRIGSSTPIGPLGSAHYGAIYLRTTG